MKSEKINSDLLKKYTEDTCSEKERAIVEEWLNSKIFDDVPSDFLFDNNKEEWKKEIWQSLSSELNIRKTKKHYLSFTNMSKYVACCAAILIIAIIGFSKKELIKNKYQDNQALSSRIIKVCDQPTFIVAEDNSEIVFVSTKANKEELYHKVNCEKGNTYIAIRIKYKSTHEILVIDQRDIQNLPPYLEMQISSQIRS